MRSVGGARVTIIIAAGISVGLTDSIADKLNRAALTASIEGDNRSPAKGITDMKRNEDGMLINELEKILKQTILVEQTLAKKSRSPRTCESLKKTEYD